jgi:demethylmenaquinone methyltransferase/2-methoxy-6-polyprenyl-1,4-benzoquinol methylase
MDSIQKNQESPSAGDADRAPAVRAMFDRISSRYDLANRVLSLGMDRRWRRQALDALGDSAQGSVLDLCAGTLDFTSALVERGASKVYAVDFSAAMLEEGRAKLPVDAPVEVLVADARDLPLEDRSVDGILCGFGLRNVPGVESALGECARVLREGGRLVILDFFQPEDSLSRMLQGSYNRWVVPWVGGMITGSPESYRYLADSIDAFRTRTEFEAVLGAYGFSCTGREFFPPVASLVVGERVEVTGG